ncbi:MAG: histidine ammonia-lyase [Planctomycetota bacterium]
MSEPTHDDRAAVELDGSPLAIGRVLSVARRGADLSIPGPTIDLLREHRQALEAIAADGLPHYGVNTGFGSLARERIDNDSLDELQVNLVQSHAAGVGEPLPEDVVRGSMVILAASLARGRSGVRPAVVEQITAMLNAGVSPVVPSIGSVGASGDLAPLAHIACAMTGVGEATLNGETLPAADALSRAGLEPITLKAKEGLALINGTHLMAAQACLLLHDADRLLRAALVAGAMSVDGCKASSGPFDPRIAELRAHPSIGLVAREIRSLLDGSQIGPSHRDNDPRVQDPYSLRCQPQVIGAAIDALAYVRSACERELGAVTDNPLLSDDELLSGGNFHGMPIALPLDHLAAAIAPIAGMAERRVFWMLAAIDEESGLSPHLASRPGVTSGLMIAQYTAAAACNEIIGLCHSATAANISTCAGIEDYNSFGPRAAAKARRAIDLAERVVAIELLAAAEAIEQHRPLRSGDRIEAAHTTIRAAVPRFITDRPPSPDIEAITGLIREGVFDESVSLAEKEPQR